MAQILDPLTSEQSEHMLCCYVNATSKIQIGRISNIPNWYFERVVFPGQRLVFEAPLQGQLEIHTGMMATAILSDKIPCDRLCISEEGISLLGTSKAEGDGAINKKQLVAGANNKSRLMAENLTAAVLTAID